MPTWPVSISALSAHNRCLRVIRPALLLNWTATTDKAVKPSNCAGRKVNPSQPALNRASPNALRSGLIAIIEDSCNQRAFWYKAAFPWGLFAAGPGYAWMPGYWFTRSHGR
ncbi:hypothetical protein [Cellvibrio japonicus]|uniref:hypothetical protein n=1 Tax=Cellvibrio japonicus TaxID=155077 RepID=UPI003709BA94